MPRTGRPRVDDPREYRVNLRFSNEQRAQLEAYCEKHHLKKAQALMQAFEEMLRKDAEETEVAEGR